MKLPLSLDLAQILLDPKLCSIEFKLIFLVLKNVTFTSKAWEL